MRPPRSPIPLAAIALVAILPEARGDDRAGEAFFEATIRPLLVEKCQECHAGPAPKGGLDLTSREAILLGGDGGAAAVPGEPAESLLIEVVRYDSEPRMPPKGRLSAPEVEALGRWIGRGMPWPGASEGAAARPGGGRSIEEERGRHWAFRPVRELSPPEVRGRDRARTPIDRFLLAALEAEGLAFSAPADRRTLIRRLSFDLTGLPPTPGEVDAFLADEAPDAYDRLVDRLLASPHHGERWARHWLDLARYSDTKGYVYDHEEPDWVHAPSYRDWVVRALNEDLPYDRFLLLQIAADREADDPADLAAMGFLTIGRRFLGVARDVIDDRIDAVTRGAIGLTVSCARCHDHKYDPIPTSDYYALYGVFLNCAEALVPIGPGTADEPESEFAAGLRERSEALADRLAAEREAAADRARARSADYLRAQFSPEDYPDEAFSQILSADDLLPAVVHRWREALARAGAGDPIFGAWHAFAALPAEGFEGRAREVARRLAGATAEEVNPIVARAFADPPASREEVAARYGSIFQDVIDRCEDDRGRAEAEGRDPPDGLPDPDAEAIRRALHGPGSPCEVPDEALVNVEFFFPTATTEALWKLQAEVDRWLIGSDEAPPHALILVDRGERVAPRILRRGNPATPGEEVPIRFLQAIAGPDPEPFRIGSGRLELARAIVDPTNPLTARVAVNRVWMHHFGEGLVRSPGDFGTRAGEPSHPDLLDWLAGRFMAEGWSVKALHRLIVRSEAYRQAASGPVDPSDRDRAVRLDPEDRLLWRMPARRLSFEELRDALLAVTGELDTRLGGRAADLFAAPYPTRRTLYGRVDRQDLPSVLRVFDFANPDLLIPRRGESTVPQQALFFLNHPFPVDRARALAAREEVAAAGDPAEKVRLLYRRAFQREPTPAQLGAALALARAAEAEPEGEEGEWLGPWEQLAQVLLMSNEFSFVD